MRSLRANLFLSAACIQLVIALISFFLPRYFINKNINKTASFFSQIHDQDLQQMDFLSKSLVIYHFIQTGAELDATSRSIQLDHTSIWEIAGSAIGQNPNIAVIQVTDQSHNSAVVSPQSAAIYSPLWARDQKGRLWIKIPEKEAVFLTTREKNDIYLLFPVLQEENLSFTPFKKEIVNFSLHDSTEVICDYSLA